MVGLFGLLMNAIDISNNNASILEQVEKSKKAAIENKNRYYYDIGIGSYRMVKTGQLCSISNRVNQTYGYTETVVYSSTGAEIESYPSSINYADVSKYIEHKDDDFYLRPFDHRTSGNIEEKDYCCFDKETDIAFRPSCECVFTLYFPDEIFCPRHYYTFSKKEIIKYSNEGKCRYGIDVPIGRDDYDKYTNHITNEKVTWNDIKMFPSNPNGDIQLKPEDSDMYNFFVDFENLEKKYSFVIYDATMYDIASVYNLPNHENEICVYYFNKDILYLNSLNNNDRNKLRYRKSKIASEDLKLGRLQHEGTKCFYIYDGDKTLFRVRGDQREFAKKHPELPVVKYKIDKNSDIKFYEGIDDFYEHNDEYGYDGAVFLMENFDEHIECEEIRNTISVIKARLEKYAYFNSPLINNRKKIIEQIREICIDNLNIDVVKEICSYAKERNSKLISENKFDFQQKQQQEDAKKLTYWSQELLEELIYTDKTGEFDEEYIEECIQNIQNIQFV